MSMPDIEDVHQGDEVYEFVERVADVQLRAIGKASKASDIHSASFLYVLTVKAAAYLAEYDKAATRGLLGAIADMAIARDETTFNAAEARASSALKTLMQAAYLRGAEADGSA